MGIPSYYKRLLDRHPQLVNRKLRQQIENLYFDFNCLIYQCLHDKSLPPYDGTCEWEGKLLDSVSKYIRRVCSCAGNPPHVFIAVDGVVPMAKIRQQRMRRFKSVWLAEEEARCGARTGIRWDTNAITPGTLFMDRLATRLEELSKRHGWVISDSHESGEGEQKIMDRIRKEKPKGSTVVYGLDGDLIVLSLLHAEGPWFLMREAGEFGLAGARPEDFVFLDIISLKKILCSDYNITIENYVCAMSLLGNDFVPHSLSVKLRSGGHDILLKAIAGKTIVENGQINWAAFREIFEMWRKEEPEWISSGFSHKYKMRTGPPKTDYDRLMLDTTNLPIKWAIEKTDWSEETGLHESWKNVYSRWCYNASTSDICSEYMYGIQWVWDYYNGRDVDMTWYYPWFLPPLWSELAGHTQGVKVQHAIHTSQIEEQEQLAMVLPKKSWDLVRNPKLRTLPDKIPSFWPDSFTYFSVGRRWFWECETIIPILTIRRLRNGLRALA